MFGFSLNIFIGQKYPNFREKCFFDDIEKKKKKKKSSENSGSLIFKYFNSLIFHYSFRHVFSRFLNKIHYLIYF